MVSYFISEAKEAKGENAHAFLFFLLLLSSLLHGVHTEFLLSLLKRSARESLLGFRHCGGSSVDVIGVAKKSKQWGFLRSIVPPNPHSDYFVLVFFSICGLNSCQVLSSSRRRTGVGLGQRRMREGLQDGQLWNERGICSGRSSCSRFLLTINALFGPFNFFSSSSFF